MNNTKYCVFCLKEHEVKTIVKKEKMIFKDIHFMYKAKYYYCAETEEYWTDEELIRINDISMKDAYRKTINLLTTKEIINIRKKYGVTQTDFCYILGWGAKTIARYETFQIQSKAHDNVLRKIGSDPKWFLDLLRIAKHTISKKNYYIYKENAEKEYTSQMKKHLRKAYNQMIEAANFVITVKPIKSNLNRNKIRNIKKNRRYIPLDYGVII